MFFFFNQIMHHLKRKYSLLNFKIWKFNKTAWDLVNKDLGIYDFFLLNSYSQLFNYLMKNSTLRFFSRSFNTITRSKITTVVYLFKLISFNMQKKQFFFFFIFVAMVASFFLFIFFICY